MDVERLIELGSSMLGMSGDTLKKWVSDTLEQEEAKRKEEEARKIEEEKRKVEEEKRRARDQERFIQESQIKKELLEKETELAKMKLGNPDKADAANGAHIRGLAGVAVTPKLQPFDDTRDSVFHYLMRFERFATVNGWSKDNWAIHLSALLKGKALEAYSRLSDKESEDYDKVKLALLEQYNLTAEGFRSKFRNSRPDNGEKVSQFRVRLIGYWDKWLEMAKKNKESVEDVADLILQEQLMNSCSSQLQVFLKERKPTSSQELVSLAEMFIEAHGQGVAFSKHKSFALDKKPNDTLKGEAGAKGSTECHKCGKIGHWAKDCPKRGTKIANLQEKGTVVCAFCKKRGHTEAQCWKKQKNQQVVGAVTNENDCGHTAPSLSCGCRVPVLSAACETVTSGDMPVAPSTVNGKNVMALRDSGCSCVVVRKDIIGDIEPDAPMTVVHLANGRTECVPIVQVSIKSPFYEGTVNAVAMKNPLYDLIIGNIPNAKCPGIVHRDRCNDASHSAGSSASGKLDPVETELSQAVVTRQSSSRPVRKLKAPSTIDVGIDKLELIRLQTEDSSLDGLRKLAETGERRKTGKANESRYAFDKGVLMRYFQSPKVEHGDTLSQVVVPTKLREKVMHLGHETLLAGHLAAKKTADRVLVHFYWPNVWNDIARYCQSCDQCQRSAPKGKVQKVPMEHLPLIDEPFSRIAIDLVGPIQPASERGHRYILTAMDFSTRFPDAVPLKSIDTERVAEALVEIFSRVGVPKEILSDRGTQFTSDLMKEVCRLLSIKQLVTSPYHPQCNGMVERFNGTLKMMLKKMTSERPRDWDRYIPAALFAYREAPQESLGFSPFELLYGRTLRGPMAILKELWTEEEADTEVKTTYQYVVDLKSRLEETMNLARENLRKSNFRHKKYFDKRSRPRSFSEKDKVLLLLPTKHNKLELKWQGPFEVVKVLGHNNYRLLIDSQERTYHANMLKKYYDRQDASCDSGALQCAAAAVIQEIEEADELGSEREVTTSNIKIELPQLAATENYKDVKIFDGLTKDQQNQLHELLQEFSDVLTDVPGRTNLISHDILLTSPEPIRKRPYPVPQAFKETMKQEVDKMIEADIIEPSVSPYSSPSVIVKKKDGSNRYCIDFRALNNISVFDAEPMPRPNELFQEIGNQSKFLTKIDLSKGYWQIPMSDNAKRLTAFATERGLYQFKVMPFGLQGAPATFSRLMRKVTSGLRNVHNYLDDCLLHTESWEDHLICLKELFVRLREAGLTARPTKCEVAYPELEFLGHMVGNGKMFPTLDKVQALRDAERPHTKKEMRSFLGLASFYRRYVPNFAAIASPLTDATKKGKPNVIEWEEPQERAYVTLRNALLSKPVLRLPDFDKPFLLQTDASNKGLGAILLQEYDSERFPVVFLSRKLSAPEQNYSVVEKECLALVWAVKSLDSYLQGREFVVLTDHAPLLYLNKAKSDNGRLMRWALLLHQYRFRIESVKGKDNHGPDFLSRS